MPCKVFGAAVAAHFEAIVAIYILLGAPLGTVVSAGVVQGEIFLDNGSIKPLPKDLGSEAVHRIACGLNMIENRLNNRLRK